MVHWKRIRLGTTRLWVRVLASLSGLRVRRCRELWCRLQTWLRSCVAVAVVQAGGYSSDSTPNLGTSKCCRSSPRNGKKTKKKKKKNFGSGVPVVAQQKRIQLGTMRLQVQSLASLSGLRIWHCHGLWCRSQTRFGSGIAVAMAQASSGGSNLTPSRGTSICSHKRKEI